MRWSMCTSRDAPESRINSVCICICVFLEKEGKKEGDAGGGRRGRERF